MAFEGIRNFLGFRDRVPIIGARHPWREALPWHRWLPKGRAFCRPKCELAHIAGGAARVSSGRYLTTPELRACSLADMCDRRLMPIGTARTASALAPVAHVGQATGLARRAAAGLPFGNLETRIPEPTQRAAQIRTTIWSMGYYVGVKQNATPPAELSW